jgi:hypothetical protein
MFMSVCMCMCLGIFVEIIMKPNKMELESLKVSVNGKHL